MTNEEIRLETLRGAFETVRRGEDGPYLAENTLIALNSAGAIGIQAARVEPDHNRDEVTRAYIEADRSKAGDLFND